MARLCSILAGMLLLGSSVALLPDDGAAQTGAVVDEAGQAGRDAESLPMPTEDYFRDMDGGLALDADEVKGRNMWLVWSGGNDRFWDGMTASTFGAFDLLKIVAYDPRAPIERERRWTWLGL